MTGTQFNHREFAELLRGIRGDWAPIERAYSSPDVARSIRYQICGGRLPAYQPKGHFEAYIHPARSGYGWTVEARYIGQPEQQPPLTVHWDRQVTHPGDTGGDTVVHCLTADGQPVRLHLDDELREALGLLLIDPNPDDEEEEVDA